jgi:hypothetical protein
MKFSQRIGKKPATKQLQNEAIDDDLKNSLWNALKLIVFNTLPQNDDYDNRYNHMVEVIWLRYFKHPIDTIPLTLDNSEEIIRSHFFEGEWYETYDLLEFIANYESRDFVFDRRKLFHYSNKIL